MLRRSETLVFASVLGALVFGFFSESLGGGKVLSPSDVVFAEASFREFRGPGYEPANRLLIDPVLQFEPWLEFNRAMLRRGRLPLWNPLAGCGAPHLANGQSAVFDPFHAIAYLGTLPGALSWIAASRLWVAGLGMFAMARAWGFGPWGRWFAGLAYPFCGFLVAWLLYPVTSVAIWMPWLFLATDRAIDRPGPRGIGVLATATGLVLLGGHVQTSAHVLLAAAGYAAWRMWGGSRGPDEADHRSRRAGIAWCAGIALGVALAAVEVVPLGCYLARSPVWTDRASERAPAWAIERPRVLDAACTALPYAFGSQRRGHPNLARALGVANLNESAGGFAGLATLIWLAPAGWCARWERPRATFLAGMVAFGALGAFGVPPVSNLLRLVPVLDVMDNRRLVLWVAFGMVALGGIGLDYLERFGRGRAWDRWIGAWLVGAAGLAAVAAGFGRAEPWLRAGALRHYARAGSESPGAVPVEARARADRQVRQALAFVPRYYGIAALHVLALAALATALRCGAIPPVVAKGAVLAMTMADLIGFGVGLNPAIDPADDRPEGAVLSYLKREVPPPSRIVAVGAELPPNLLMRYGLADVRNYDSVELTNSLDWFAPLYEAAPGRRERTSRRAITWQGVVRARDRLALAGVRAVVGDRPPPAGAFGRVDRVGDVWIARMEADAQPPGVVRREPGRIEVDLEQAGGRSRIALAETYDPGWRAEVDGRSVKVGSRSGAFLEVEARPGSRRLALRYDPPEVRLALGVSAAAMATLGLTLAWPSRGKSPEICLGRPRPVGLESNP